MASRRMISRSLSTSHCWANLQSVGNDPKWLVFFAKMLYVQLVVYADDEGRLDGDAFTIKHRIIPTEPVELSDVERAIDMLKAVHLVTYYWDKDRKYIYINDFLTHQPGLTRRAKSLCPKPPEFTEEPKRTPDSPKEPQDSPSEETLTPTQKGNKITAAQKRAASLKRFTRWWVPWPNKAGKKAAEKAWLKLDPDDTRTAELITAVERQIHDRTLAATRKVFYSEWANPATWLNGERWNDELKCAGKSSDKSTVPLSTIMLAIAKAVGAEKGPATRNGHFDETLQIELEVSGDHEVTLSSPKIHKLLEYRVVMAKALFGLVDDAELVLKERT